MAHARALGPDWDAVNVTHLGALREAVDRHGGVTVRTEGDALFAAFQEAGAGILAAIDGQRALHQQPWPAGVEVRVRMGLHTGEAHLAGDDYGGFEVNRAARIAAAGHGGQVILSETTTVLVADALPEGTTLARPRATRAQGRSTRRALEPARHRRAAERVPTASNLIGTARQPARSDHVIRGP